MTGHISVNPSRMNSVYDKVFAGVLVKLALLNTRQSAHTQFRNTITASGPSKSFILPIDSSSVSLKILKIKNCQQLYKDILTHSTYPCISLLSSYSVRLSEDNLAFSSTPGFSLLVIWSRWPAALDTFTTLA